MSPQSQFGNAYYHPNLPCILSVWPSFDPHTMIVIPEDISARLTINHKSVIAQYLNVHLT